jgi:hypothetical protein
MKKLVAVAAVGTMLIGFSAIPAHAGGPVHAALALGAFIVLSPLLLLGALAQPFYVPPPPVAYTTPAPVYAPAPAPVYSPTSYAPAPRPAAINREVVYSDGRHLLLGDGVTTPYRWVWVPNPPPGYPPPPPPR